MAVGGDALVLGWIANAHAHGDVVEHCIYANTAARSVAQLLLDTLIAATEAAGIWTIQSGVFPRTPPALPMHQQARFRFVGVRERVGRHRRRWREVVLIERRSPLNA